MARAALALALVGWIGTKLYLRASRSGEWRDVMYSAVFSYGIFISYFAYYYRFNMAFLLVYTVVVARISRRVDQRSRARAPTAGVRRPVLSDA